MKAIQRIYMLCTMALVLFGVGIAKLQAITGLPVPAGDESNSVQDMLQHAFNTQAAAWQLVLLAFLAGVVVSFTPCIYPMVPITLGILQTQARASMFYNFLSSISYVMGIAVVYATLGYLSATFSVFFGKWYANPLFILFVICFFLYLAFSLFGFYEIYVPSLFGSRSEAVDAKKSLFHCFLFGLISGTVASPCLTPVLGMLLGFVAKHENPMLGFATLFSFSLGMGTLLVLAGTFSTTLTLLPRAGEWMDEIKKCLGFAMLAVCVYFAQPLLAVRVIVGLYAAVMVLAGGYFLISRPANWIKRTFGLLLLAAAAGYLWVMLS